MWGSVGNDILTSLFFRAKLKILKGKWIRDLNAFGNTQHASNPLNTPYTTEIDWGLEKWQAIEVIKTGRRFVRTAPCKEIRKERYLGHREWKES